MLCNQCGKSFVGHAFETVKHVVAVVCNLVFGVSCGESVFEDT